MATKSKRCPTYLRYSLFAHFPDRCLLVPFYHIFTSGVKVACNIMNLLDATLSPLVYYENLISHPRGLRFGTFYILYITLYYFKIIYIMQEGVF